MSWRSINDLPAWSDPNDEDKERCVVVWQRAGYPQDQGVELASLEQIREGDFNRGEYLNAMWRSLMDAPPLAAISTEGGDEPCAEKQQTGRDTPPFPSVKSASNAPAANVPSVEAGATKEYRMLEVGETIQEGDEFQNTLKEWRKSLCVGEVVRGYPYRRPIPSPTPQAEPAQGTATPRTDKRIQTHWEWINSDQTKRREWSYVDVDFARTLERELADARRECERLTKERGEAKGILTRVKAAIQNDLQEDSNWDGSPVGLPTEIHNILHDLRTQLAAMTAERDQFRQMAQTIPAASRLHQLELSERELHAQRNVAFADRDRLAAELEQAKKILAYAVADGEGREFFPYYLDGSPNEMFEKAAALTAARGAKEL